MNTWLSKTILPLHVAKEIIDAEGPPCAAVCKIWTPGIEMMCTRDKHHMGPHVATGGIDSRVYAIWVQS